MSLDRRLFVLAAAALPLAAGLPRLAQAANSPVSRVRPGRPGWPSSAEWDGLRQRIGGRLVEVRSPLLACKEPTGGGACDGLFKELKNPYFIGDDVALTQTAGWVDAWNAQPSVYAVAAETTDDIVAAVNFAREKNLRLVVKGGGHSYLGRSNAPDSLLIWTRHMNAVTLHDAFVPAGCGKDQAQPAVSVGAGAIWGQVYDAVTTKGGRLVQGGGCLTVGVAGLVQAGGFGSFSKQFGTAAASLIEAEIVTADGQVRIANACTNPDLFWALKGGGGGSLGVVTRLTLKTHELPRTVGFVGGLIHAESDDAYRRLIARLVAFYA
ncbi:MAG TPA: FAD-dependent oxidoreductase, partial [Stellaceae bacterium]|nr:FAD-dependent oxidoreductase [Stellaceae bacterium]